LNPDALTIGFARRFATYKRAPLIFQQFDNIVKLVRDKQRSVQFMFAGKAHPRDDDGKRFIQQIIHLSKNSELAGYVVFTDDWINQLYVHPARHGQGVGSALLEHVMADQRPRRLWTFQQSRARKFYEDRGFAAVKFTDGAGNEEKTPDVCYEWRPDRTCPGV